MMRATSPTLRAMRLDLETLSDSGPDLSLIAYLIPLLFPLFGLLIGPVGALALGTVMTTGFWALCVAGLFVNTNGAQSSRLSALLPVVRPRQVAARYLMAGVLGLACVVELIVQAGTLMLIEAIRGQVSWNPDAVPMSAVPLIPVIGCSAAAFVVIVALEMPFYYALEFTKASNWFWSAVFMVSGCVAVAIMLMPDEALHAALTTALAMPGWLWGLIGVIGCAAAVAVSYAVSRHIWLRKEL